MKGYPDRGLMKTEPMALATGVDVATIAIQRPMQASTVHKKLNLSAVLSVLLQSFSFACL